MGAYFRRIIKNAISYQNKGTWHGISSLRKVIIALTQEEEMGSKIATLCVFPRRASLSLSRVFLVNKELKTQILLDLERENIIKLTSSHRINQ